MSPPRSLMPYITCSINDRTRLITEGTSSWVPPRTITTVFKERKKVWCGQLERNKERLNERIIHKDKLTLHPPVGLGFFYMISIRPHTHSSSSHRLLSSRESSFSYSILLFFSAEDFPPSLLALAFVF